MVRLFASVMRREPDGHYLVTPQEKLQIDVEDTPLLIVELVSVGKGRERNMLMTSNTGETFMVSAAYPLLMHPVRDSVLPCLRVRDGLVAKLNRSVYYELMNLALDAGERHDGTLGVWSAGEFFPLDTNTCDQEQDASWAHPKAMS